MLKKFFEYIKTFIILVLQVMLDADYEKNEDKKVANEMMGELEALFGKPPEEEKPKKSSRYELFFFLFICLLVFFKLLYIQF